MAQQLPIKKQVRLNLRTARLGLDVAQDLFSSHQVDQGSTKLLSSLEAVELPEGGEAVDFGCGYGVLGIAWQAIHPGWSMRYVDRDALAVAFAEHNVGRLLPRLDGSVAFLHDATPPKPPPHGFDLVLWNVPGKAGDTVLASLMAILIGGLGKNGLLALVVVNPLADLLRHGALERHGVLLEKDEPGRDHTVLHLQKRTSDVSWSDAFKDGIFDRPNARFTLGDQSWELTPVIGLPEYDSLSHSTMLAGEMIREFGTRGMPSQWMAHEPGTGHLAVLARMLWPDAVGHLVSRDALALHATGRALERVCPGIPVYRHPVWGIEELMNGSIGVNVAVSAVPDQATPDEMKRLVDAVGSCVTPGGMAIMHGGSTSISRLERQANKNGRWRSGKRTKRRGSAAIPLLRRDLP